MIKNYFKTMFRSLLKNKSFSLLNIMGLATGIACAGLIFLWVENEVSYDKFHEKKDRLFYVRENQKYDTYTATFGSTPGLLGPAMQAEIPGIANTCRSYEGQLSLLFSIGDKSIYASGKYAEPSLFSMFTLPFIAGNERNPFPQVHSIVITESAADKFFGNQKNYNEVIGKSLRVDNKQDFIVSGVVKDVPKNSSLQFEWIMPFKIYFDQSPWLHRWGNNSLSTYVELQPGVDPGSVDKLLYNFIQQKEPGSNARPFLWSINNWRLYDQFENGKMTGGGRIEYVRLFSIIAWIILLIACINFMNLSTARSEKRAREVGVRKVLGARKGGLITRFIGEALFMASLGGAVALLIIILILPAFNTLVEKQLEPGLTAPAHILALIAVTIVCGLVAGSYPSLYLSSYNPVSVLKGIKSKSGNAAFVRKGLVVLQFTISIILIISTIIIYRQIQHVKNRQLGFDKNNLIEMEMQGEMAKNYTAIRQEILSSGLIKNIALSDHTTIYGGNNTGSLMWEGKAPGAEILISTRYVTSEFITTSGMKIMEGRDFQSTDSINDNFSGQTFNVLITQSFAKLMGNENKVIGKNIYYQGEDTVKAAVVGVVNDYLYGDMYGKPDPVMFVCTSPPNTTVMYLRLHPQAGIDPSLATIRSVMKKNNPAYPFEYKFVDDQFNEMFISETLISKLSRLFASLAIIISCLGLFGLSAFTAEQRTKEIGIRKVLGASVPGIAGLLSKDFMKLVLLSCLIAFPVAWWSMDKWLQNYAYRIEINWIIFLMAGAIAICIALVTISFQSIKAALANPVRNLRTE